MENEEMEKSPMDQSDPFTTWDSTDEMDCSMIVMVSEGRSNSEIDEAAAPITHKVCIPAFEEHTHISLNVEDYTMQRMHAIKASIAYLRKLYLRRDDFPRSVDEILKETGLELIPSIENWLRWEALDNHPKIRVIEEKHYLYKPMYDVRSLDEAVDLLKTYHDDGLGGILLNDLLDTVPTIKESINDPFSEVRAIRRPADKKLVLFYNPPYLGFEPGVYARDIEDIDMTFVSPAALEKLLQMEGLMVQTVCKDGDSNGVEPAMGRKRQTRICDNKHVLDMIESYVCTYDNDMTNHIYRITE